MNTATQRTSHIPGLFEPPALRLRAALPARQRTAPGPVMHDFLVTNPRPDLSDDAPTSEAPADHCERRRCIEPDSIFWSPETHAGDAA